MAIRITCIKKANGDHETPCEAITTLGWINDQTGNIGRSSRREMYNWIKNEAGYAYVQIDEQKIRLITAESSKGTPYVKTSPNDTEDDNLLKLSEC